MNLPGGIGSLSAGDTVPTSEISALSDSSQSQLTDTGSIERSSQVDDGQGTETDSWSTVASVAYRLSKPKQQREVVQAGGLFAATYWSLSLPLGTDCIPSDRFRSKENQVFQVVDTDNGLTNPIFLTATVVRDRR